MAQFHKQKHNKLVHNYQDNSLLIMIFILSAVALGHLIINRESTLYFVYL